MATITQILKALRQKFKTDRVSPLAKDICTTFDNTAKVEWHKVLEVTHTINKELYDAKQEASALLESVIRKNQRERDRMTIIFDSLLDSVLILDCAGNIQSGNLTATKVLGAFENCTLEGMFPVLGIPNLIEETRLFKKFLASNDCLVSCEECKEPGCTSDRIISLYCEYLRVHSTALNTTVRATYERADGTLLTVAIVVNALALNPSASDFGYIAIIRNLTETKKLESRLANAKAITEGLMSIAQTPLFYKKGSTYSAINQPFLELLGLEKSEVLGKSVDEVFSKESATKLQELYTKVGNDGNENHTVIDIETCDGKIKSVRMFVKAITTQEGVVLAGSIQHHTEFDFSEAALVHLDGTGTVVGCNNNFALLVGSTKHDLIGKPKSELLIVPEDCPTTLDELKLQSGGVLHRLCLPIHTNGDIEGLICVYFAPIRFKEA